jgi:hypothetical protein
MSQQQASPTALPQPEVAARPSAWTGGRIAALVTGVLLALVALVLLGAGGTALWGDLTQREGGYVTTGVHHFTASGSALSTEKTDLGSAGVGWLYAPGLLDKVRIRVTPASPDSLLFVGIGRSTDVDRYLAGVNHTVISDFRGDKAETVSGNADVSAPGKQGFWVASSTGPGARTLVWKPADGSWTVVAMNANGRPGIDIGADVGARVPALVWVAIGLLVAGVVFMTGAGLLIGGAIRRRRAAHTE